MNCDSGSSCGTVRLSHNPSDGDIVLCFSGWLVSRVKVDFHLRGCFLCLGKAVFPFPFHALLVTALRADTDTNAPLAPEQKAAGTSLSERLIHPDLVRLFFSGQCEVSGPKELGASRESTPIFIVHSVGKHDRALPWV